jgi:hypothetical protein
VNIHSFEASTDKNRGLGNCMAAADGGALRNALRTLGRAAAPSLVAATLVGSIAPGATAAELAGSRSDQARIVGVFTGRFVDGVPVYQLPPLTVVASRRPELAKSDRDGPTTRIGQARARAVTRPPA